MKRVQRSLHLLHLTMFTKITPFLSRSSDSFYRDRFILDVAIVFRRRRPRSFDRSRIKRRVPSIWSPVEQISREKWLLWFRTVSTKAYSLAVRREWWQQYPLKIKRLSRKGGIIKIRTRRRDFFSPACRSLSASGAMMLNQRDENCEDSDRVFTTNIVHRNARLLLFR